MMNNAFEQKERKQSSYYGWLMVATILTVALVVPLYMHQSARMRTYPKSIENFAIEINFPQELTDEVAALQAMAQLQDQVNKMMLVMDDLKREYDRLDSITARQVTDVTNYIGYASIVVGIVSVVATILALGMSLNLSLREDAVTKKLNQLERLVGEKMTSIQNEIDKKMELELAEFRQKVASEVEQAQQLAVGYLSLMHKTENNGVNKSDEHRTEERFKKGENKNIVTWVQAELKKLNNGYNSYVNKIEEDAKKNNKKDTNNENKN